MFPLRCKALQRPFRSACPSGDVLLFRDPARDKGSQARTSDVFHARTHRFPCRSAERPAQFVQMHENPLQSWTHKRAGCDAQPPRRPRLSPKVPTCAFHHSWEGRQRKPRTEIGSTCAHA
jgi:hypothetical protein